MDKILDMMAHWTPMGQGIFFLLVFWSLVGLSQRLAHYLTVLVRGYPPLEKKEDKEEDKGSKPYIK